MVVRAPTAGGHVVTARFRYVDALATASAQLTLGDGRTSLAAVVLE